MLRSVCCVSVVLALVSLAAGQTVPSPDYAAGAFATKLTYDNSGGLWAFDGKTVHHYNAGTGLFGAMDAAGDADCALGFDPAGICFTAGSGELVLLRGYGGFGVPDPNAPAGGVAVYDVATDTIHNLDNLDNLANYSIARAPGGTLYVVAPKPGGSTNTLYTLEVTGGGAMTEVMDLSAGLAPGLGIYSGAIAFDAAGNLYATPFRTLVAYPQVGLGEVPVLKVAAAELGQPSPTVALLDTLSMNGSQDVAVAADGTVLISSFTGVRRYDPAAGTSADVFGTTTDAGAATTLGSMAVDPITGDVNVNAGGELVTIPEPCSMALGLVAAGGMLLIRRRRGRAA